MKRSTAVFAGFLALVLVLGTASLISYRSAQLVSGSASPGAPRLMAVRAESAQELIAVFKRYGYAWRPSPGMTVPALEVAALPGDLAQMTDVARRKTLFLRAVLPLILAENKRLLRLRHNARSVFDRPRLLAGAAGQWLERLLQRYNVSPSQALPAQREALLRKLDTIPVPVALAQAAIESGWGTSRFLVEGNSLFGLWTYVPDAGLRPQQRKAGQGHLVRKFPDLRSSVRSYLYNLNVGHAYKELRAIRYRLREQGEPLDGMKLVDGLSRYSQRGDKYLKELRTVIKANRLYLVADAELASVVSTVASANP